MNRISTDPCLTVEAFLYSDKKPVRLIAANAVRIIISIIGAEGTAFTFLSCVDTGADFFGTAVIIILSCVIFGAALSLSKKYILPAFGAAFAVYAVNLHVLRERFCNGMANVVNLYLEKIEKSYAEDPFFYLRYPGTAAEDTRIFISLTVIFIAMVFAYGIVYKSSLPAVLAVSVPVAELCLYFGLAPDYLAFFMLLASLFAVFALDLSMPEKSRAYRKISAQCGLAAALAALLCAGTAVMLVRVSGYTRPQRLDEINEDVSEYFRGGGFSEDIAEIKITELIKRDSTVNHGKLGDNGNITFDNVPVLKVTMPRTSDTVYLRGYVGSVYTGDSWKELSGSQLRELEELNSSFRTEGLNTLLLGSYNLKMTNPSMKEYSFSISNVGTKSNCLYMPYNLVPESVSRYEIEADAFKSDGSDMWFGKLYDPSSVYGYKVLLNTAWVVPSMTLGRDQNEYREFVLRNYLDIPDNFKAADEVFTQRYYDFITAESGEAWKSTLTDATVFGRKLYYIKSWLRDNCEYSLKAGKLPAGKDFADYFLNETRKGSCSHFATAAALLCRYAGIPARYVEGYVIKPSDFDTEASFGTVCTVDVTDARAHAWVEVYIDGFGWYPVEFTSGYGNVITAVTTASPAEEASEEQSETEVSSESAEVTSAADYVPQPEADGADIESSAASVVTTVTSVTEASASVPEETHSPTVGFSVFGRHDGEKRDVVYDLTGLLAAAFAVSAIIAVLGIRRVLTVKSCYKALDYDNEKAVKSIYRRFGRLVKAAGIKVSGNIMYSDYIKLLESRCEFFSGGIAETVVNTALKAEFGGGSLTGEDVKNMYSAVSRAVKKYESTLNRPKRFFARFIIGIA